MQRVPGMVTDASRAAAPAPHREPALFDDPSDPRPHPVRANIAFHILFPTITIALGWVLLFFKLRFQRARGDAAGWRAYRLWVKVFALSFALGVVSGITMSFQFGTNWPGFMEKVGNIAGPLLGLRGADRLLPRGHVPRHHAVRHATACRTGCTRSRPSLVAVGTTVSAFWILVLNSWMQTPRGLRDRTASAHRRRLVGDHLQPVAALPPHAHAARLGPDRRVPDRRPLGAGGCCAATVDARRAATLRTGVLLAAVLIPCRSSSATCTASTRWSTSRPRSPRWKAIWETERRRAAGAVRHSRTRSTRRNRLRDRHPQRREPDPDATTPTARCRASTSSTATHPPVPPVFFASASWSASAC